MEAGHNTMQIDMRGENIQCGADQYIPLSASTPGRSSVRNSEGGVEINKCGSRKHKAE